MPRCFTSVAASEGEANGRGGAEGAGGADGAGREHAELRVPAHLLLLQGVRLRHGKFGPCGMGPKRREPVDFQLYERRPENRPVLDVSTHTCAVVLSFPQ